MGSLYDELGIGAEASADELRRAYRRRARQLHPDHLVEPSDDAASAAAVAMARLNHAWEVLGDPESRRRYDRQHLVDDPGGGHRSARWSALPWLLFAGVMLAIFVFTAYAAPGGRGAPSPGQPGVVTTTERSITASTKP